MSRIYAPNDPDAPASMCDDCDRVSACPFGWDEDLCEDDARADDADRRNDLARDLAVM